jgi:hypothetical protein
VHPDHEHRPIGAEPAAAREERVVYAALCLVGAIPIAVALAHGGAFGVEPTLGLIMALAGAAGLAFARRGD